MYILKYLKGNCTHGGQQFFSEHTICSLRKSYRIRLVGSIGSKTHRKLEKYNCICYFIITFTLIIEIV